MVKVHSLKMTSQTLFLITEIDELKGVWQSLSVLELERPISTQWFLLFFGA